MPFVREKRGPTLETLDFIIRIGSTPTFLYFNFINQFFRLTTSTNPG